MTRSLRIAMIARVLPRPDYAGGVSGQVHLLATALAGRGHDVTVYSQTPPPNHSAYRWQRLEVGAGRLASLYLVPLAVSRLSFEDYDVVHSHGEDHLLRTSRPVLRTFYGSAWAEARNSRRLRHRLFHLTMSLVERVSARRATRLAVISTATRRYLRREAAHIPCGYDPAMFFPGDAKSQSPSILFVGDLGTRKRADLLLRMFDGVVRAAIPDAELWLVTSEVASGPGVRWLGRVSTAALADLYRRAWVFCLPSSYEGFGVPYVEAMASGTPVVATPNGGAEEILGDGRWGCLVDVDSLGRALVDILQGPTVRRDLTEKGLVRARDYQIDKIAGRYEETYLQLLEGAAASLTY
jgi:phosphatidyl-myo-inositol alpha-mannosyltransferase